MTVGKRKRHTFNTSHTCYLEVQLGKRLLDSQEGRQNVAVVLTKESGGHFDVTKINTWVRNHKHKKGGGGMDGSRVVPISKRYQSLESRRNSFGYD